MSVTIKNLEAAFAGESQAHVKYRYFAKLAREQGYEEVAKHFEHTAEQEVKHAWGHLELLVGTPNVNDSLQMAIDGETYEYTEMYPKMYDEAVAEGNDQAAKEAQNQIQESVEHAEEFKKVLELAAKRFKALQGAEKVHASKYQQMKQEIA
jgi:hypothetical protein